MEKLDLYRCEICGNIVQVLFVGGGELVCCGEPMKKFEIKTRENAMLEKHVPIFMKDENGNDEIRVGEILHPMTQEHYIMLIEAISEDKNFVQIKFLSPEEEPKMSLCSQTNKMIARELCNIHGLWEGSNY